MLAKHYSPAFVQLLLQPVNFKTMNIETMTLDEKREALYDWIRNLDEEVLDSLIEEYINGKQSFNWL